MATTSPDDPSTSERRGIPVAEFVEDVENFLAGREADVVIRSLDERLQQYKLLEMRLIAQRRDTLGKLPDIRKCLDIVKTMSDRQESGQATNVDFEIAEGMFTQATIKESKSVCLWLGANVMVEYPFEEALALLTRNEENASEGSANLLKDAEYLQDQINTTQVTIARVFNWDVSQRRMKKVVQTENS